MNYSKLNSTSTNHCVRHCDEGGSSGRRGLHGLPNGCERFRDGSPECDQNQCPPIRKPHFPVQRLFPLSAPLSPRTRTRLELIREIMLRMNATCWLNPKNMPSRGFPAIDLSSYTGLRWKKSSDDTREARRRPKIDQR